MLDFNLMMMLLFVLAFMVLPFVKRIAKGINEKVQRGELVRIHGETSYRRQRQLGRNKSGRPTRRSLFGRAANLPAVVITFNGDQQATGHELFALLVDEVVENKACISEVVVRVTSPGGSVPPYGLMLSHMERLRDTGVPLTACIDTFGASGGYMIVAPATKIVANRLAILASIGVVSHMLNFHSLLERLGVESLTFTAGDHKRLLTATDKPTDEAIAITKKKLEEFHAIFIEVVRKWRPQIPLAVCNGDTWPAQDADAKRLGLVDELGTSAAYISNLNRSRDVVFLSAKRPILSTPFGNLASGIAATLADRTIARLFEAQIRL